MELNSPEVLVTMGAVGSYVLQYTLSKVLKNSDSVPVLASNLKTALEKYDSSFQNISEKLVELKVEMKNLKDQKTQNRESIIHVEASMTAYWKEVDDLKVDVKQLQYTYRGRNGK